jgi:hypothetical protein
LNGQQLNDVQLAPQLVLLQRAGAPRWLTRLQYRFCRPLLLDRHWLHELEENLCIGSLDQGTRAYYTIDTLRHILAIRYSLRLQTREFPVSLLRLYFAGQQHLCGLIDNIDLTSLIQLGELAHQDQHSYSQQLQPLFHDELESLQHKQQKTFVHSYICRVLDLALCSFERTLCLLHTIPQEEWPQFGLEEALKQDPFWKAVPQSMLEQLPHSKLLYACVWRCHVTLQLERLMQPWLDESQREWLQYQTQLFRDTHLDLFSVMWFHKCYDDEVLAQHLLPLNWPACDRVCCAGELPDMASYMLDNFKTGSHLKSRKSLREKVGHILFNKTMNNICKDRNFFDITVRDGEQDELIYDLIKLIALCVLLGNLPKTRGSPCLMMRIRCVVSFWPEMADRVLSEQELAEQLPIHRNPQAMEQAKREKKRAKEEARRTPPEKIEQLLQQLKRKQEKASYEKTCFKILILKCPYTIASWMKEFMFSVMEGAYTVDELLSANLKWRHYKDVVRMANGKCRQELQRQICEKPDSPLDHSIIESVEKPPGRSYEIKRGKMIDYHACTLFLTTKAIKREWSGTVTVKSIGTEEDIPQQLLDTVKPIYRENDDDPTDYRPSLEELHIVCWYMAKKLQQNPVLETRWFQVLGMSKEGCEDLREWLFSYCTEEVADDSMKRDTTAFRTRSMHDYILMRTVFEMVNYERRKCRLFFLPVEMAVRQIHALRTRQLCLHDWEPTPPLLGIAYQCYGCMKFANAVVQPLNFVMQSNYCELVRRKNNIYNEIYPRATHPQLDGFTNHNLVLGTKDYRLRVLEYYHTQVARTGIGKNERHDVRDPDYDKEKHIEELEDEEYKKRRENISFLNVTFYNVEDDRLYCVRSRRQRVIVRRESTSEANVIMHCTKRPTRIESTHFTTRTVIDTPGSSSNSNNSNNNKEQQNSHTSQRKRKKNTAPTLEDEDEDAENEETERTDEPEDFRPTYESNPLLFNPSVATLREKGREYLSQWFSGQTNTVMMDTDTTSSSSSTQYYSATTTATTTTNNTPTSGEKRTTTPTTATAASQKKVEPAPENKKKFIMRAVSEPLSRIYNCQKPLEKIDMVGIVKNGKVLCVECGVMTEHCSFSMSPHGPVCMRHANVAFTRNHPVWQMDSPTAVFMQRRQAHDTVGDMDLHQKYTPGKRRPHPCDVVARDKAQFHRCQVCHSDVPTVSVPYSDEHYALRKAMCCLQCYRRLRPFMLKQCVLRLNQLIVK